MSITFEKDVFSEFMISHDQVVPTQKGYEVGKLLSKAAAVTLRPPTR